MARYLPSVAKLRAFEASARHLSFTRAALELNLTQTAISHQISSLEDRLGLKLFDREHNNIRLTTHAQTFLDEVKIVLNTLSAATDRVMDVSKDRVLTIGCLSTFGMNCLIPNLHGFRTQYPNYSLRVSTVLSYARGTTYDFDVAIIHDTAPWTGFHARHLGSEIAFPVCSPQLLKRGPPLKSPEDLQYHTCIRTESETLRDEWPAWLERAGVPDLTFADEIKFNRLFPSVQGAVSGLGIIMGRLPLIQRELAKGGLLVPFDIGVKSTFSWYAVASPAALSFSKVTHFLDWVSEHLSFSSVPLANRV